MSLALVGRTTMTRAMGATRAFVPPLPKLNLTNVFQRSFAFQPFSINKRYTGTSMKGEMPYKPYWWAAAVGVGVLGLLWYEKSKEKITLEQLKSHSSLEKGLWIAWQDPENGKWYVSEMASFVKSHPGGDRILEAGGKAAMPFWQQFARHLGPSGCPIDKVLEELRSRMVGELEEAPPNAKRSDDPYALEPNREAYEVFPLQMKPFNAGQIPENLTDFYTPNEKMFVRLHTPAPLLQNDPLTVQTPEGKFVVNPDDLKHLPTQTVASVLQCTGHRRSDMPETNGLQWDAAVGNVSLIGYSLWPLLNQMGIQREQGKYLLVQQLDTDGRELFSTCIPLDLLPKNTMLATHMNGEPLTRDHGGRMRLFIPGYSGNFQVKNPTVMKIVTAEAAPADKVREYAALGPWAVPAALSNNLRAYIAKDKKGNITFDPKLRVNSLIHAGKEVKVPAGTASFSLTGWAWGSGEEITDVDISIDGGQTWKPAKLDPVIEQPPGERYAWTRWEAEIPLNEKTTEVLVRAADPAKAQPPESPWNERGLRVNHYSKTLIERD